jgi:hypothetical protein
MCSGQTKKEAKQWLLDLLHYQKIVMVPLFPVDYDEAHNHIG